MVLHARHLTANIDEILERPKGLDDLRFGDSRPQWNRVQDRLQDAEIERVKGRLSGLDLRLQMAGRSNDSLAENALVNGGSFEKRAADHKILFLQKQCGQAWKGHGGPLGAQLSRRLPDGPGQGGGGETDPREPRRRVQAPAHQGAGDAGADPGGDAPVPHPGQGGGDVRAVPAGPDHRDAPG